MLQMTVLVLAESLQGEAMKEEARTMVVNAHGGLMKLKMELKAGQPLTLVNPKTNARERARIVRIDEAENGFFAAAFEFVNAAPQFWPVVFPPADWGAVKV